jgi:hypothetical protein
MSTFIGGKALCRRFFQEAAQPILMRHFPDLAYTAGLLGYGSDVLGYDDEVSTDHMWGPRFYLFLREEDVAFRQEILEALSRELPPTFLGYSVHFSEPDPNDNGVRHAQVIEKGPVSPLIFLETADSFLTDYLGCADFMHLTGADWLSFSEHKLLALQCGEFYEDKLGMAEKLRRISAYPPDVQRYLIASQWSLIGEEQAFVKRASSRGDEIGSRLVCARIADRLMRLCCLYAGRFAPYSKWYGTAFAALDTDPAVKAAIAAALAAMDPLERENRLIEAQSLVGHIHNAAGFTEPVACEVVSYFGRDIRVIYADRLAAATKKTLSGTDLEGLPLIGSLCQIGNLTELTEDPAYRQRIREFFALAPTALR